MTDIQRYTPGWDHYSMDDRVDGDYVAYDDHTAIVAALQEQVQKLAAENDWLLGKIDWPKEQCPVTGAVTDVQPEDFIPATEEVIREIGANAVDEVVKFLGGLTSDECGDSAYLGTVNIAAKLRAGEQP